MAKPTLTSPPPAPQRTDSPDTFVARADAHVAWQSTNVSETRAAIDWMDATFTATDQAKQQAVQSAQNAATSEGNAADSAAEAGNWANQTGSAVDGTEYSAKEYASGTIVPSGSAKEWATTTGGTVDGAEYGAKEYASGTTVPSGSSKYWAEQSEGYKDSAETAAAAAQSAAGLPSLAGNASKKLGVKADESGVEWQEVKEPEIPIPAFESALFHAREEKPNGASGGGSTAGVWSARILNTVLTNQITGTTLSGNAINLPPGIYYIDASCPANLVSGHKGRLFHLGSLTELLLGTTEFAGQQVNSRSVISGRFQLSESGQIVIQHRCAASVGTYGLGSAAGAGAVEIYTDVKIWRLGDI